ncbi:MAG: TcpQ domain-containing protein [Idiomarina sp.]|nr:TcpQ domain-containing protein [Idiomarina sp.]
MAGKISRRERRKQQQNRAVAIILVVSIVAIVIAFFAARNMYLNESTSDARGSFDRGSGYTNLQGEISRFFGGVRDSAWGRGVSQQWVIELEQERRTLTEVLEERAMRVTTPVSPTWRGEVTQRWFMEGDTLKQTAERLAEEEEMNLIWWLRKDYIIRSAFQVNTDLLNTMNRLARSVSSDHPEEVQAFLCYRQRAILIAGAEEGAAVQQYCQTLDEVRTRIQEEEDAERDAERSRRGL